LEKAELAKRIKASSFLTGKFKLRSGKISDFYWDKYRFESDPELLEAMAEHMAALLPPAFDRLAGLEMGGIPLATALSLKVRKPVLFVRKKAKEYGTCNLAEGGFNKGETVVVVEDVITTAGQVCASIGDLKALGLNVTCVICAIERGHGGRQKIEETGCAFKPLFTMSELEGLAGG